ncbi:MAG: CHRD domain-containing protein [Anaerolineae bacterium]|nr:CHRD domain-containing protein [Gloeobacterales cyanobacterium ES-bin-313]
MRNNAKSLCFGLIALSALCLPAQAEEIALMTTATGAQEVPGPGDVKAVGVMILKADADLGKVCYNVSLDTSETLTAAHIHAGAVGVAGKVVLPLTLPTSAMGKTCVDADKALISKMIANPENYYFNAHSATYKDGALRGQLAKVMK